MIVGTITGGRMMYVRRMAGDGGVDWEWTATMKDAAFLTPDQVDLFVQEREAMGENPRAFDISEAIVRNA